MTPLSFLPDSSRACSLTRALLKLAASVVSREPSALELMAMGLPVEPLNRKQGRVASRNRKILDSYRDFLTWAFGGDLPMRFLTMSNAYPQMYGHIYSKAAELLFELRSH
jgi:hypothetical protein